MNKKTVLELRNLTKHYAQGGNNLLVLDAIDLSIHAGEMVGLVGPSGCGKSTLLQIAGLLDFPNNGEVRINGKNTATLGDAARTQLRNQALGFIYQQNHLLSDFSALENVTMPQLLANKSPAQAEKNATQLLVQMGLKDRLQHRPGQLSGGEQQRVAIARALINKPAIVLADEPTGNLDPETAENVFAVLLDYAQQSNTAMLVVTHNPQLAKRMDTQITLQKHKIKTLK